MAQIFGTSAYRVYTFGQDTPLTRSELPPAAWPLWDTAINAITGHSAEKKE